MVSEVIALCLKKGYLLDKEMLEFFNSFDIKDVKKVIDIFSNLQIKEKIISRNVFDFHKDKFRNFLKRLNGFCI